MPENDPRLENGKVMEKLEIDLKQKVKFAPPAKDDAEGRIIKGVKIESDADEEACSVRIKGYPSSAKMSDVEQYFSYMAKLRGGPKRVGDDVVVSFKTIQDCANVVKFMAESPVIGGNNVKMEPIKPQAIGAV